MSTSIYESTQKKDPVVGPPSSRRCRVYRRDVYGEKESQQTYSHRTGRHSAQKRKPITGYILILLAILAGLLVGITIFSSIKGSSFGVAYFMGLDRTEHSISFDR